jgi:hypothetical protein
MQNGNGKLNNMKKYQVVKTNAHLGIEKGEIVYECLKHDFGTVREASRIHGTECIAITKKEDGDYPFIVVPLDHIELIKDTLHTPGPWTVFMDKQMKRAGIEAKGISIVVFGAHEDDAGIHGKTAEEALANAHLIAAAPELLLALESFVTACDTAPPIDLISHISSACKKARAAIAKAKGGKP